MRPAIFVHPLSPTEAVNLQRTYQSPRAAWSRTRIQIASLTHKGYTPPTIGRIVHISNGTMRRIIASYEANGLSGLVRRPGGRLIIEILPVTPERIEVTVTRTCDNPVVIDSEEELLKVIVRLWPGAVIKRAQPMAPAAASYPTRTRRGGPAGTPEARRIQIVRGWLRVQGRMTQEIYASRQGVAASTLRRWRRQLDADGKL